MSHGGKRVGAGRKPGAANEIKRAIAEQARDHAEVALKTLVDIARNGEGEAARVSAANAILDRAYGKPSQAVDVTTLGEAVNALPSVIEFVSPVPDDAGKD